MIRSKKICGKATVRFNIEALKSARTKAGWTQEQLARFTGWSTPTIQRAEAGVPVSIGAATAIHEGLNTRLEMKIRLGDLLQKEGAAIFLTPGGDRFEMNDNLWTEYKAGKEFAIFDEFDRDDSYIYIVCKRRVGDGGKRMYVRIPIHGGDAQWTWENPLDWVSFVRVTPKG